MCKFDKFDSSFVYLISASLVTKQLLGNVFKTFQNGWILVEMLSFLLLVFRFFLMEFHQLVFIYENQQLKTNINEMFETGCTYGWLVPCYWGIGGGLDSMTPLS